ncbi:hypothetical protein NM688_g1343 [Phlebia brevispora]|uniref:Uncharacterized protein n=1 Tax=Phlebia brevispora TaxID=194682 RepID=A0ACC1TBR5_9APHY|nr:hypothetical protein NM688_g1343 [Phlebia brevispora]
MPFNVILSLIDRIWKPVAAICLSVIATFLWKISPEIYKALTSPLRHLPGPRLEGLRSYFLGSFATVLYKSEDCATELQWLEQYGHVIQIPANFNIPVLLTSDTRAVNYLLTHSGDYQKSEGTRRYLRSVVGAGVLVEEGESHRRQRRVLNPAFGPAQLRELTEIFFEKGLELRDAWASEIKKTDKATKIEIISWLNRATLDIIGLAGFNYHFESVSGKPNELEQALRMMFNTQGSRLFGILQMLFPPLKLIRTTETKKAEEAQATMRRIGMQIIADRKAEILAEKGASGERGTARKDVKGRDLLSLLIKSNMAVDIPDSQRLSDEEVLGQVPTFIVAGHETTSGAIMWCLFSLSQAHETQSKLRDELLTVKTDTPTMDELNALPYLDMVVRETLRFHAPVPMTDRVAEKDDVIPLEKPFADRHGQFHESIRVSKGCFVLVPIAVLNRSKEIWGEDALEFKPERWLNLPEATKKIPGVWSDMMTFIGGPRACIGYRFAILEMKALLFTLLRSFEFDMALPASSFIKRSSLTQRPLILGEEEKGNQMPLMGSDWFCVYFTFIINVSVRLYVRVTAIVLVRLTAVEPERRTEPIASCTRSCPLSRLDKLSNLTYTREAVSLNLSAADMLWKVVFWLFLAAIATVLWKLFPLIKRALTSPLRHLPGPHLEGLKSYLIGGFAAITYKSEDCNIEIQWLEQYGHVMQIPAIFNIPVLLTSDTRAINYILTHSLDYQKSKPAREVLRSLVGAGVLVEEGMYIIYRIQFYRRVLNPAFGPAQLRELTDIFFNKALELRDVWISEIKQTGSAARIEVLSWLNRVALDVIGLAGTCARAAILDAFSNPGDKGFNYHFESVSGKPNELERAFSTMFKADGPDIFGLLQSLFPPLKLIRTTQMKKAEEAQATMRRIGMQIIADRKAEILAEKAASDDKGTTRKDVKGRDLLSLLIKSNMANDIPDSQRLSDEEVLGQVPTFIVAGHETTSGATMWCLYALSQAHHIQTKLREELLAVDTDIPTMDELNALPYLDMVVREALRFHAPVPMTHRVSEKDDFIPLEKPFTDRHGKVHDNIHVSKGSTMLLPIAVLNRSKELWGEDALEFKPERWLDPPEAAKSIPGVWSDMLTFLGGSHSCIGYRFAIVEMKALLFTLLRAFEFDMAVPASSFIKRTSLTQRPMILGEEEKGNQMPLMVKIHRRS